MISLLAAVDAEACASHARLPLLCLCAAANGSGCHCRQSLPGTDGQARQLVQKGLAVPRLVCVGLLDCFDFALPGIEVLSSERRVTGPDVGLRALGR